MDMRQDTHGHLHPLTSLIREATEIFGDLGFSFASGPEAERELYNFDRLNLPAEHPARDMQDTFWLNEKDTKEPTVLRTHTSSVQARYLESHNPPLRIIVPGKVFRNEATDATHEAQFYQLEGLCVEKGASLSHLKGVLEYFFGKIFRGSTEVRFRPSFFGFVEPGVEVDMRIVEGESPLKGKWIELLGAGMVHPRVLEMAGIDPDRFTGYAFGMGVDRVAMLRYGFGDVRESYTGDLRFVNQF